MDFFDRQIAAKRRTVGLVILFALAILIIVPLVYFVFLGGAIPIRNVQNFFSELKDFNNTQTPEPHPGWWDGSLFLTVSIVTLLLILAGTIYQLREVLRGGYIIARMLGGRAIPPNTDVAEEKRLLNIVEEMAIASGLPVPEVYLLPRENGINAFSAGMHPNDAVIGVTQGCLDMLSRDELQAVVAHEFSHVLNDDTRLKTILIGLLNGLIFPSKLSKEIYIGSVVEKNPLLVLPAMVLFGVFCFITIPLLIVIQIGVTLANVIKRSVSREREYLADAAAIQFTRNPNALTGAMKKVGGHTYGSCVRSSSTAQAGHLFFATAQRRSLTDWFWIYPHPPLKKRIHRIDPHFSGTFKPLPQKPKPTHTAPKKPAFTLNFAACAALLDSVGTPTEQHLKTSRQILAIIPDTIKEQTRDPFSARAIVYALLLDTDPALRNQQCATLRENAEPDVFQCLEELLPSIGNVPPETRLPLLDLSIPALRLLSKNQYIAFRANLTELINADGEVTLFEYALRRILTHRLDPVLLGSQPKPKTNSYYSFRGLEKEVSCLLSLMAQHGQTDEETIACAFEKAVEKMDDPCVAFSLLPKNECSWEQLDRALLQLNASLPALKRKVLEGVLVCLMYDQKITVKEVELFRAIADTLDCPVPPWVTPGNLSKTGS